MEVKDGYKRSDLGAIPDKWDYDFLENVADVIDPHPSHRAPVTVQNGIPFLGIGDLNENGEIVNEKYRRVDKYIYEEHKLRYDLNENLIGLGRVASIGKVIRLKNNLGKYTLSPTLGILRSKSIYDDFLFHILNSSYIKNFFKRIMSGSTRSSVGMIVLRKISIPLPPLPEQQAIAEVLTDTDNLIQALEKQIAKKRLIKKGAMQELLKPKEGWKTVKFGDLGFTYGGLSGKSKNDFKNGNSPYIPFMNIMSNPIIDKNYLDYVGIKLGEQQNKAQKGDLFFNGSSETPEEVGMCSVLLEDVPNLYLNSFCFGFRLHKESESDGLFLSYLFRSTIGRKLFYSLAQGATRYNLSKANFMKMEIIIPQLSEQKQISRIFSDIDNEIFNLELMVNKHKQIKQGLRQNLLTGKIRLV